MKTPKIRFWQGASGLWYIHVVAANGQLILDGGQGYSTKSSAKRAVKRVKKIVEEAVISDEPMPVPNP